MQLHIIAMKLIKQDGQSFKNAGGLNEATGDLPVQGV